MLGFLFAEEGTLFIKKSFFEEFNLVSSRRSAWSVMKFNQSSEVFAELSGTFCTLWPRNYVLEREFMYL